MCPLFFGNVLTCCANIESILSGIERGTIVVGERDRGFCVLIYWWDGITGYLAEFYVRKIREKSSSSDLICNLFDCICRGMKGILEGKGILLLYILTK